MTTFKKDYFNDNSLDAVWAESYGTGGSGNESGGVLRLEAGTNWITTSTFGGSGVYQGSIAGDFDVKIKMLDHNFTQSYNNQPGLAVYIDSTHYMFIGRYISSAADHWWCYKNGGSSSSGSGGLAGKPLYLRVARSGSTITLYSSTNGIDWTSRSNTALGTGDVQIWLQCGANSVDSVLWAEFDAAVNYSDNLDPYPIINTTPTKLSPSGNNVTLTNPPSSTISINNSGDDGTWLNWTATTSAAASETYYFDDYNASNPGNWDTSPGNVVDGSLSTVGSDNENGDYLTLTSNTYSGGNSSDIAKVEVRVYFKNNYDVNSDRTIVPYLIPYFSGTNAGDNHGPGAGNYDASNSYPDWSDWYDITEDTNAPATWSWSDVENLDLRLQSNRPNTGRLDVYKVELRISESSWMSIDPTTGSDHTSAAGVPPVLKVYFDIDGYALQRGKHYDAITLTDSNATNSPYKINVTLTIQGSAARFESVSDTLSMSDSAGAQTDFNTEASDTFKLSDISEGKNQIYVDDITLKWTIGTSYAYDTLEFSDSAAVTLEVSQSVSDTLELSDEPQAVLTVETNISDTLTMSDSGGLATTFNTDISDTFKLSEATTPVLSAPISVSDALELSDTVTVLATFNSNAADTITMSDSGGISASFVPQASDTLKLSEAITPTLEATFSVSDALELTDSSIGGLSIPVTASDTFITTDSSDITATFNTNAEDTLILSDSVSPILVATVSISDGLELSDSSLGVTTIPVYASDSFKLSESLSVITAFNATVSDSFEMAESINAVATFIANAADELKMSDTPQAILTVNVSVSEGLELSDNTTETVTFITSLSDSFKLSDTVSPVVSFSTSGADVLIFTDDSFGTKIINESISDSLKMSDSLDVTATFNTIISDILKASDVSSTIQDMVLSVSDSINFSDISTGERIIHVKMIFNSDDKSFSFVVIPKTYMFTTEKRTFSFNTGVQAYHFIINN